MASGGLKNVRQKREDAAGSIRKPKPIAAGANVDDPVARFVADDDIADLVFHLSSPVGFGCARP